MTATLRGWRSRLIEFMALLLAGSRLGEECHYRFAVLGARVANALGLAALGENLLGRHFETLVEDGLAKSERGAGALAQFGGPRLRVGQQAVRAGLSIDDAERHCFIDIDLAAGKDQVLGLRQAHAAW